jgi:hypothetical protein
MSGAYNTALTPEEEAAFQKWAASNPRLGSTYDYDARGFWRDGAKASSDTGHGGDRWKKPNHPTFSTQSQYNGVDGFTGGSWGQHGPAWTFTPSQTNVRNMPMDELLRYFQRAEPGNVLFSPWER